MSNIPEWAEELTSPLDAKLGITLLELAPDRVIARMPVEGNQQPLGLLHGGATGALVESAASIAAIAHARTMGKVAVGVDLHVTHLEGVTAGAVTATATAVRRGRTVAVYRAEVRDDAGRMTAVGQLTCQLVEPR